jgi:hypothetical protein
MYIQCLNLEQIKIQNPFLILKYKMRNIRYMVEEINYLIRIRHLRCEIINIIYIPLDPLN